MSEDSKPKAIGSCPHCGIKLTEWHAQRRGDGLNGRPYSVCCSCIDGGCGACGPTAATAEQAIIDWQRRAPSPGGET